MVGGGGAVARSDDLRAEVKQAARALAPSSEKKPSTLIEFRGFLGDARVGVRGRNNVKPERPQIPAGESYPVAGYFSMFSNRAAWWPNEKGRYVGCHGGG